MKITHKILLLFILFQPSCVNANSKFSVNIAIVDVQLILEKSLAISGIREFVYAINQNIQNEFSKKESELKKAEEEIFKKKSTLNEEDFNKEVSEFEKELSVTQKDLQDKRLRLEQAHSEAIQKVHTKTIEIITQLSKKYNFNLVLPSSQVLFAEDRLNITQEVLSILNNTLKEVKVSY